MSEPNRYAEYVYHGHMRRLETLDIGESPFWYTMPDEGTERAYTVAKWYLFETQGDYYTDMYANV